MHEKSTKNISEVKKFCKEEWQNISKTRIKILLAGYKKTNKGKQTKVWKTKEVLQSTK